jgi:hypothetical protein
VDFIDILGIFHPAAAQCIFFSSAHRALSQIDHILEHKTSLNRYMKIKITPVKYQTRME